MTDIDPTTDTIKQAPEEAVDSVEKHVASIRHSVRRDLRAGKDWACARRDSLVRRARDKPVKTAAYAVGAGLLMGMLLRRR